jgi:hypothetical protein
MYMKLKFLALQGAPYIYDISRLRVNILVSTVGLKKTVEIGSNAIRLISPVRRQSEVLKGSWCCYVQFGSSLMFCNVTLCYVMLGS